MYRFTCSVNCFEQFSYCLNRTIGYPDSCCNPNLNTRYTSIEVPSSQLVVLYISTIIPIKLSTTYQIRSCIQLWTGCHVETWIYFPNCSSAWSFHQSHLHQYWRTTRRAMIMGTSSWYQNASYQNIDAFSLLESHHESELIH